MPLPVANIEVPQLAELRPGLLDVATGPMTLPTHARSVNGQWESEACSGDRLYPTPCQDVAYPTFTYDPREALSSAYSFNVYASEICTPVGTNVADARRRVANRLRIGEQIAVERALWGGANGVTGVFETLQAAGKVTFLTPGAVGPVEGLSLLEQQMASLYAGPAIIHARPRMAPYFGSRGLFDGRVAARGALADHQRSHAGSIFNFGAGYSGEDPTGVDPTSTTETVYATGRVLVWRDDEPTVPDQPSLLNTTTNQRSMWALRTYAIGVECVVAAVTITRTS